MTLLIYCFVFLVGLMFGSFLNAWVWRIHTGLSIVRGRSLCPNCRVPILWHDNLPVVSFLLLGGKCRGCHGAISRHYPLIEMVAGLLFVVVLWYGEGKGLTLTSPEMIRNFVLTYLLLFIFLYDFLYQEILDITTLYASVILFLASLFFGWQTAQSMILGIVIGAGFFLLQYIVSSGRWIGGGDIRLGFLMGVILGFPVILVALMIAYVVGAFVSVILLALKKKQLTSSTPFGTYLAIGTWVAMLWGGEMVWWYVGLLK